MDEYDEIARRFFNQFLELKVQLDQGMLHPPVNHEKEVEKYRKVNAELKKAAADLVAENRRLEEALALAEESEMKLRAQYNEAIISLGVLQEKLSGLGVVRQEIASRERAGYRFTEHMSDESRRAWETLMKEVPRGR